MRIAYSTEPRRRDRRGTALVLVLVLTVALASLALSAIYLASNAGILSASYEREQDFRYAAEAALAMGKSRVNNDPFALPDTGYVQLISNGTITGADGQQIPGITVNVWIGPTGSTTGQDGRFASVVAEAQDASGARYVRRLELVQESFAKFAYWTDKESNNGQTIYFNNGDILYGPVWTNDIIHIGSGGATFADQVGTAQYIQGIPYGTFMKGYQQYAKPIQLPSTSILSKLQGYASSGGFAFTAPSNGDETTVLERVEFVPVDLQVDADTTPTGPDEGFFRVYVANSGNTSWLRGDYGPNNCGDWHYDSTGAVKKWRFYPAAVHSMSWYPSKFSSDSSFRDKNASFSTIMSATTTKPAGGPLPRCYLGGDPHLAAVEGTNPSNGSTLPQWRIGGTDSTFNPDSADYRGRWLPWTGTVPAPLKNVNPPRADANYLWPLYRGYNPGTQGVIYVSGTVGVSGVLRGDMTLYGTGTVVILDNLKYETNPNPSVGRPGCPDMLGLISGNNIVIADNGLNTPQSPSGNGTYYVFGAQPGINIQSVMMALNTSFTVQNYANNPMSAVQCGSSWSGRGCLNLTGGVIQEARGPVGTSNGMGGGTGYVKRYTYDRCALINPPPFFPTTGRFMDNRYYEMDPSAFNVAQIFQTLKPH